MNVLQLILDNLRSGAISYRRPCAHICTSNRYRGLVRNDAERCVGCASCAYVCPTGAIEVTRSGEHFRWSYDPGKCTFCGRCVDRCRLQTLSMESRLPPLYNQPGDLRQVLDMMRKRRAPVQAPVAVQTTAEEADAASHRDDAVTALPQSATTEPAT